MKKEIFFYKIKFFMLIMFCSVFFQKINAEEKLRIVSYSDDINLKRTTKMSATVKLDEDQLAFAKETIRLFGDQIPQAAQENILLQKVVIGMSPYEAKLAAGAFYFKVEADSKIWPDRSDPLIVIDRQSITPDESKIWMTFETETQFPGEGKNRFEVYFIHGKAEVIKKIAKENR